MRDRILWEVRRLCIFPTAFSVQHHVANALIPNQGVLRTRTRAACPLRLMCVLLLAFRLSAEPDAQPGAQASPQPAASAPLPDIHQLMVEVEQHQKQLDKVREN
ncbi:MAG: hypothetical protein ABSF53_11090, partial [Terracidiphilus sp.]